MPLNIEIKAICKNPDKIKETLLALGAEYKGCDRQKDTYYKVHEGRLKLREGNIENNLIFYKRTENLGLKNSQFLLHPVSDASSLNILLEKVHGIKVVVSKQRHIYFIENVKFHVDEVQDLGNFVEIEASNLYADKSEEELKAQCDHFIRQLDIRQDDFIAASYSDLLLNKSEV